MKFIRNKGNISVFGLLPSRRAIGQQFVKEKKKKEKGKNKKKKQKRPGGSMGQFEQRHKWCRDT